LGGSVDMPELCFTLNCNQPGDDEYTFYQYVPALGEFPVTWKLCGECCEFAIEIVECVSNLESEVEAWIQSQSGS
jgi:hypothetical protein